MKYIGITQRLEERAEYSEMRESLDVGWIKLLRCIECIGVPLSINSNIEELINSKRLDGVIFSGGNDLSSVNNSSLSKMRDEFEKKLLIKSLEFRLPILGACRGCQFVAEFFGATVFKIEGHVAKPHVINAEKESLYFDFLNRIHLVNSYHNYGIKDLPPEFIVSARADDGSIESVESRTIKIFCQMWHPERELNGSENQLHILKKLFHDR